MAGNTILNSTYGITYNNVSNAGYINTNGHRNDILYMNSNMAYFANNCRSLALNLNNWNVSYDKVTTMGGAFMNCFALKGNPVCGNNVTSMAGAYYSCSNLTGSPVCGPNVTNLYSTYAGCNKLTGSPACGPNVTNMTYAYYACRNLTGTMQWLYNNTSNNYATLVTCKNMFRFHDNSKRINIWCKPNSAVNNRLYSCASTSANSMFGAIFTWTTMTNGYYNAAYNIYVYYNH